VNELLNIIRGRGYKKHTELRKDALIQLIVDNEAKQGFQQEPEPKPEPQQENENENVNISIYDKSKCKSSRGVHKEFPFKKEDILAALKEEGVPFKRNLSREELCEKVTDKTMRLMARRKTRRNARNK
jgi:hypothetical protein